MGESPGDTQVVIIARERTATVLHVLDPGRRASLIRFLNQASLLTKCIEDELKEIDLSGANLSRVKLSKIDLRQSNLSYADLGGAFIRGANLHEADLSGADLSNAKINNRQLDAAKSLQDAIMPNGKKHS